MHPLIVSTIGTTLWVSIFHGSCGGRKSVSNMRLSLISLISLIALKTHRESHSLAIRRTPLLPDMQGYRQLVVGTQELPLLLPWRRAIWLLDWAMIVFPSTESEKQ